MAKKTTRKRTKAKSAPKSSLPAGFWAQVSAVALGFLSFFLVLSWFGYGGNVLVAIHGGLMTFMGWATYFLPAVLIFISVEIFRHSENKIPTAKILALLFVMILIAGFFGLFKGRAGIHFGGMIGSFLNSFTLQVVNSVVAGIIYLLLVSITTFAVFEIMPIDVIRKIGEMLRENEFSKDDLHNAKTLRNVKTANEIEEKIENGEEPKIKLNAGVDFLKNEDREKAEIREKRALKISKKKEEKAEALEAKAPRVDNSNWELPSVELLEKHQSPADAGDIEQNAVIIQDTFREFGINVEMEAANVGPRLTQYTLRPPSGVKLNKISSMDSNLALNLAAETIRIEAPIPGKSVVGIEVPNRKAAMVRLFGILESKKWKNDHDPLSFAVGKDISGETITADLAKMPHLLIAGTTGSGKSVMMNTLLTSLLYKNSPSQMKLILVDPKQVEMAPYQDIPHLLTPVIEDVTKTVSALKWAVNEMERRYSVLKEKKIRNIERYHKMFAAEAKAFNEDPEIERMEELPYVVIVIDELSDLMSDKSMARDAEALIVRIAQKARAVGIHLVLATQKPVVSVVTGLIKGNIPSRISFKLPSNADSRTILDRGGAEKLLGQGDMLFFANGMPQPKRIQGVFLEDAEVNRVMDFLRLQSPPQYNDEIISQPVQIGNMTGGVVMGGGAAGTDETFREAVRIGLEQRKMSTGLLQRKMRIGYGRAAGIIDEMEERGIVGPSPGGSKPREMLISSMDEIEE
jgi:S-DNA-T family DNA segregation ATPase FtsK/SpoIIIE